MEKYKAELLPAAYADLDEIFYYIIAENPQAADSMLDNIMEALRRLEIFPHSGAPLLDRSLKKFNFRMVIIDPYIAFYRFLENKVYVYRVFTWCEKLPSLAERYVEMN